MNTGDDYIILNSEELEEYRRWRAEKVKQKRIDEIFNKIKSESPKLPVPEYPVCRHFGCGKKLTIEEQRFGDKCISHSKKDTVDINKALKFE